MKLLLSFDCCREALGDFQVLPHVIDAHSFQRLYRVCKLWELEVAEQILAAQRMRKGQGEQGKGRHHSSLEGEVEVR